MLTGSLSLPMAIPGNRYRIDDSESEDEPEPAPVIDDDDDSDDDVSVKRRSRRVIQWFSCMGCMCT